MTGHETHAVGGSWGQLVGMAALMSVMMAPFLPEPLALVRERSLRRRRLAATTEFAAAFTAVWFGVALCLLALSSQTTRLIEPMVAFGLASVLVAAWQLSNTRSTVASRCGRVRVPPASGWRSDLGTFVSGAHAATACVRTCGASMLLMAIAPSLVLMVLIWLVHLWEWRPGPNPFVHARRLRSAVGYGGIATLTLSVTMAG